MSGTRASRHHLRHRVDDGPAGLRIALEGCIDEHADLGAVERAAGAAPVTIDLGELAAMNSAGISRWIQLLEALTRRAGAPVRLARCPFNAFVLHAAMIANMTRGAVVESVLAPYACGCGEDRWREVRTWQELEAAPDCSACRRPLVLDALPDLFSSVLPARGA